MTAQELTRDQATKMRTALNDALACPAVRKQMRKPNASAKVTLQVGDLYLIDYLLRGIESGELVAKAQED
jgi:hypothetical protein